MPTCIHKECLSPVFLNGNMVQTLNPKNPNMGETIRKSRVVGREAFTPEATAHKAAIIPQFVYFKMFLIN